MNLLKSNHLDLLLHKKKISSKTKKQNMRVAAPSVPALAIDQLSKLINEINIDIDVVTFEHSLKEDWMEFTDTTATLMNRKSFL